LAAIANGAPADRVCKGGVTPLVQAVEHGKVEAVVMLAKAGASINVPVRWVHQEQVTQNQCCVHVCMCVSVRM
jgi:oxalate decarboxylase/phosphoglucose isomerase-like protein (cupin superfamily)